MKTAYIIASALLCLSSAAMAQTKMVVTTADGTQKFAVTEETTGEFTEKDGVEVLTVNGVAVAPVSAVTGIRFIDETKLPFIVTDPSGQIAGAYESVPSMLRVLPTDDNTTTQLAFGTVAATEASELAAGDYGVYLSLSAAAINAGGISDLAGAEQSCKIKLYTYADAQAVDSLTTVTGGSVSYKWLATRRMLTLTVNATFSDGTTLKAEYSGTPADVESVDAMVPEKTYGNELVIVNAAGTSSSNYQIQSVKKTSLSSYNSHYPGFKFTFNSDSFYDKFYVEVRESVIGKGTLDMTSFTAEDFYIYVGDVQVAPAYDYPDSEKYSYPYKNHVDNGTIRIDDLGDNVYEIFFDFVNSYSNFSGDGQGSKEHITLHWKGAVN